MAAGLALGALIGIALVALAPTRYRSEAKLLYTDMASVESPDLRQPRAIQNEVYFLVSDHVGDPVRATVADPSATVEVEVDGSEDIVTLIGYSAEPGPASQLTETWVNTYLELRRQAAAEAQAARATAWSAANTQAGASIDDEYVNLIGQARLDGNDEEVARLEAERDAKRQALDNAIPPTLARADGVEVLEPPSYPLAPHRPWLRWQTVALALAGLTLGAVLARLLDRRAARASRSAVAPGPLPGPATEPFSLAAPGEPIADWLGSFGAQGLAADSRRLLDDLPSWSQTPAEPSPGPDASGVLGPEPATGPGAATRAQAAIADDTGPSTPPLRRVSPPAIQAPAKIPRRASMPPPDPDAPPLRRVEPPKFWSDPR